MKLLLVCLLTVCSLALGEQLPQEARKLQEVLRQLNNARESLLNIQTMVITPPRNIEDCCCLEALRCFQKNLQLHHNTTNSSQKRLLKSLKNHLTERGLDFCRPEKSSLREASTAALTKPTCESCASHPQQSMQEFVSRLESLLQRAFTRLIMK